MTDEKKKHDWDARQGELHLKFKKEFESFFELACEDGPKRLVQRLDAYIASRETVFWLGQKNVPYDKEMDKDLVALEKIDSVLGNVEKDTEEFLEKYRKNCNNFSNLIDSIQHPDISQWVKDIYYKLFVMRSKLMELTLLEYQTESLINKIKTGYTWMTGGGNK